MNLIERIEYIIKNNPISPNISESEFARSIGTYPTKIAEIKSGKVKSLAPELALEISKKYKVDFQWLLTGEGNALKKEIEDQDKTKVPIDYENTGSCGCGAFINDIECPDYIYLSRFWIKNILRASIQNLMIIFANGDSMEDTIQDGDMLLVDKTQIEPRNGVYLIRFQDELFVKRIQILHKITLKSDNPHYDPIEIDKSDLDCIQIIGKIVWNGSKKNI